MSRRDIRRGRAIMSLLDTQRRLETHKAVRRGDLRYCYERMMNRRPGRIIRYAERVPLPALADAA